jgi:GNAT superfamily N-acetyltransferase
MSVSIKRLSDDTFQDFSKIHCNDTGWCQCVAWWVPTWDGWSERTSEQNAALRESILASGVRDGFLIYVDGALAGWCQAWKRDAFEKIVKLFGLHPDEHAWMIGCVLIKPEFRKQGTARAALGLVVQALRDLGAKRIEAFPKRQTSEDGELWNGPESTYLSLGFEVVHDDPKRPVLRLSVS